MKVICVKPPSIVACKKYGIKPLEFMNTYTVEKEVLQPKGIGYVLAEVNNSDVPVFDKRGRLTNEQISYHASRFIPLSDLQIVSTSLIKQTASTCHYHNNSI